MDLVGSIVCGHLNKLNDKRVYKLERDIGIEDLIYVVVEGTLQWRYVKWSEPGLDRDLRLIGGWYEPCIDDGPDHLIHRVVDQLQRRILTQRDIVAAVHEWLTSRVRTNRCQKCKTNIGAVVADLVRDPGRLPDDPVLTTALDLVYDILSRGGSDHHDHDCVCMCAQHQREIWARQEREDMQRIVVNGKILATQIDTDPTVGSSAVWLTLNGKPPLGWVS